MSASTRVRGFVVANVVIVAGVAALVGDARANEPEPGDPCRESRQRADAAATTTIVARPVAVADAGVACPASRTKPARGCVVGVVRHGATCAPMPGMQVELGIPMRQTVDTDAAGRYRLCGVRRGEHELVVPYLGAVRKVRAGSVVDIDATFLGELGIQLAVTSIVTFEVDRVVEGPALASPATIYVQESPQPGAVDMVDVRPAPAIGEPLELRVSRDPATGVLVSESCWIRVPVPPAPVSAPAPAPTPPDAAPAPAPVVTPRSCAHCGAADPATALFTAAALLGARRRRR